MPSCLERECRWVDVSAVTINSCCSHLVPSLGSPFYPLVNGKQLDIATLFKPVSCLFVIFLVTTLPIPYIWCTSEINLSKMAGNFLVASNRV